MAHAFRIGVMQLAMEPVEETLANRAATRWVSDASVLKRYGIATVDYAAIQSCGAA